MGKTIDTQNWFCAACDWEGASEDAVYAEHPELPPTMMDAGTYPHGEARPVERWLSCPRCGRVVYRWSAPPGETFPAQETKRAGPS